MKPEQAELLFICVVLLCKAVTFDNKQWQDRLKTAIKLEHKACKGLGRLENDLPETRIVNLRRRLVDANISLIELCSNYHRINHLPELIKKTVFSGLLKQDDLEIVIQAALEVPLSEKELFDIAVSHYTYYGKLNPKVDDLLEIRLKAQFSNISTGNYKQRKVIEGRLQQLYLAAPWLDWPILFLVQLDIKEKQYDSADRKISRVYESLDEKMKIQAAFSRGQIEFFKGHHVEADQYFKKAIDEYSVNQTLVLDATSKENEIQVKRQVPLAEYIDILILSARAAEWSGDYERMAAIIDQVFGFRNQCQLPEDFFYWKNRAHLQNSIKTKKNEALVDRKPHEPDNKWHRLLLAFELFNDPSMPNVERSISAIASQVDNMEIPEQTLFLNMLNSPLTVSCMDDTHIIETAVGHCETIEELFGREIPWAQFCRAVKLLKIEHDPNNALDRLQGDEVSKIEGAAILARIALILSGNIPDRHIIGLDQVFLEIDNELIHQIPLLSLLHEIIDAAALAVKNDLSAEGKLLSIDVSIPLPDWIAWLFIRIGILVLAPDKMISLLDNVRNDNRIIALEVSRWANEGAGFNVRNMIDERFANHLHSKSKDAEVPQGSIVDRLVAEELEIFGSFKKGRKYIIEHHYKDAIKTLWQIINGLKEADPLTNAFWAPLCHYWLGITYAKKGKPKASDHFENCLNSWMTPKALGQLAMLAIQNGQIDLAEALVGETNQDHTGVYYATALIHSRKGDPSTAMEMATAYDRCFPGDTSPYRIASKNLYAALLEKENGADSAIKYYMDSYEKNQDNAVLNARLFRLILYRNYHLKKEISDNERKICSSILENGNAVKRPVPWFRKYDFFSRIMMEDFPIDEIKADDTLEPSWSRILTHRLLVSGRADDALGFINMKDADEHMQDAKIVFSIWKHLRNLWKPVPSDIETETPSPENSGRVCQDTLSQLKRIKEEIAEIKSFQNGNREFGFWRSAVDLALRHAETDCIPSGNECLELINSLEKDSGNGWNHLQECMAQAFKCDDCSDKESFLMHYQTLSRDLEKLPVDGKSMWLKAAGYWIESGMWDELLEADLPPCVEDMNDPLVRYFIGLGYTRVCMDAIRSDKLSKADKYIRKARHILEPIVEKREGGYLNDNR